MRCNRQDRAIGPRGPLNKIARTAYALRRDQTELGTMGTKRIDEHSRRVRHAGGMTTQKTAIYPGLHDAIIDEETFEKVQRLPDIPTGAAPDAEHSSRTMVPRRSRVCCMMIAATA